MILVCVKSFGKFLNRLFNRIFVGRKNFPKALVSRRWRAKIILCTHIRSEVWYHDKHSAGVSGAHPAQLLERVRVA
jgi:hypothetical protein